MNLLDDLLYDLATIAELRKYSRLSTAKDRLVIEPESAIQFVWRWRAGESRDKTISVVHNIISTVVDISDRILESKYLDNEDGDAEKAIRIEDLQKIYKGLTGALPGLRNLSFTYDDDADAKFKFTKIISHVELQLIKLKNILYSSNYS